MKSERVINLVINSSPKGDLESVSGALAQRLALQLGGLRQTIRIYESDQRYFNYEFNEPWIDLVLQAKRIILPVPMWNFTIPAALKDFFDKITKQGVVWDMDKDGHFVGLLKDKAAYVIMTSGGEYPLSSKHDFVVPYLRTFLSFLGITDVKDFRVGGVSTSSTLVGDQKYMDEKTQAMFIAFGLSNGV